MLSPNTRVGSTFIAPTTWIRTASIVSIPDATCANGQPTAVVDAKYKEPGRRKSGRRQRPEPNDPYCAGLKVAGRFSCNATSPRARSVLVIDSGESRSTDPCSTSPAATGLWAISPLSPS